MLVLEKRLLKPEAERIEDEDENEGEYEYDDDIIAEFGGIQSSSSEGKYTIDVFFSSLRLKSRA